MEKFIYISYFVFFLIFLTRLDLPRDCGQSIYKKLLLEKFNVLAGKDTYTKPAKLSLIFV